MFEEITLLQLGKVYTFPVSKKDYARVTRCEHLKRLNDDDYITMTLDLANEFNGQVREDGALGLFWGIKYNWLVNQERNRWSRTRRAKSKIGALIRDGYAVFGTLTFRDDVLNTTSVQTRRRYVQRWLYLNCLDYVANIDFGEKNHREHYHFVAVPFSLQQKIDCSDWIKTYGAVKIEPIGTTKDDESRTLKYLTKLTSHAIKESTGKQYSLIYSREKW